MENKRSIHWSGWLFLLIAVVFIGIGIIRGEDGIVLTKAVRICLECIGIG